MEFFKKIIKNSYDVNQMLLIGKYENKKNQHNIIHEEFENFTNDLIDMKCTLLTIACYYNDIELVEFLILNGADKNITDSNGLKPFDYLNFDNKDNFIMKNLHFDHTKLQNDETNKYLIDPVTFEIYDNPYIASDGQTYSKSVLDRLFMNPNPKSPLNNLPLERINGQVGISNVLVKQLVEKFQNGKLKIIYGGFMSNKK
jgi:ankyrin repeat protein